MTARRYEAWLEIDVAGFAQILRNKGLARILLEPISNALDTAATRIVVSFVQADGRATLTVLDDDPDGFADLRDAYTLFAPSKRRDDPELRGRFGQGDKELVAVCFDRGRLDVVSTTGAVIFEAKGRRIDPTYTTLTGTSLKAEFRCNQREGQAFDRLVRRLLVPDGVILVFNGETVASRKPTHVVEQVSLPTVGTDPDGNLVERTRATTLRLYEPFADEKPMIYELGVPVVRHDSRWHVNVGQKVPLNAARDNVKPSYLRRLREIMLDETYADLTSVDLKKGWVTDVLADASPEAFRHTIETIHGKNAVRFDPSTPEANKRAEDQGRPVIHGRAFQTDVWKRMTAEGIAPPAGQVIQTRVETDPDGIPPIPEEEWTSHMRAVAAYVRELGQHALGFVPEVAFAPTNCGTGGQRYEASWGGRTQWPRVTFYLRHLGRRWPETVGQEALDALVIHELTHHTASDHFTDRFIHDIARIGARLRSCPADLDATRRVVGVLAADGKAREGG